jgi:ribosomal protein L11 methyltransferase
VLAILAEMLGATHILAIDNDEWSVENAKENIERNSCKHIIIQQGSLEDIPSGRTDVILANINRNILLQYMRDMYDNLVDGGTLLMSGLLVEDKGIIMDEAACVGFHFVTGTEHNNWIALLFNK